MGSANLTASSVITPICENILKPANASRAAIRMNRNIYPKNDGDDSSSVSVLTSSTVDENQDDTGDDDDDDAAGVFDDEGDVVNALNISLDSLDTEFPRLENVLLIFVGVGVVSGDLDSEFVDDNDFGMNDETRDGELLLFKPGLRIDDDIVLYYIYNLVYY
jgi:hypothetical protein